MLAEHQASPCRASARALHDLRGDGSVVDAWRVNINKEQGYSYRQRIRDEYELE